MKLTVDELNRQIETLIVQFPELAEDDQLRADMLEGETDIHSIMSRLVELDADAKGMVGAISDRTSELSERKARYKRRSDAYRKMAQNILEHAELRKIELPVATVSLRTVPASVVIEDESGIPDECFETKRILNKAKVKEALNADPCGITGAHMSNGGQSISIRVK